jgi:hypothetical protein
MSAKIYLDRQGEPAQSVRVAFGPKEGRFGLIHLSRDLLHPAIVRGAGKRNHSRRIPGEGFVCKCVNQKQRRHTKVSYRLMTVVELNLTASRDQVREPILWQLGREFEVRVNIKKANIDQDFGWVSLELEGPVEEIQRATAWLMTTGIHVEALQRAVGAG